MATSPKRGSIPRELFLKKAAALKLQIVDRNNQGYAKPIQFKSGSVGWYYVGKLHLEVAGEIIEVQANCCFTVIGSKYEVVTGKKPKNTKTEPGE